VKKIGIFGGTFDPVHFGHLNLAIEIKEKANLQEIWLIPAQINPFKVQQKPPLSFQHRFAMLQLAVESISGFLVKDVEGQRSSPSYTIDTLKELMRSEVSSSSRFYLVLGEDSLPGFFQWHLPEEIVKLVPLLIGSRFGTWQLEETNEGIREAIQKGLVQTRVMEISSTEVRSRLESHLYCGHLIPAKVLAYIKQNQLYQSK
jgi:nicotinate-nucleotide adenylyltransferase